MSLRYGNSRFRHFPPNPDLTRHGEPIVVRVVIFAREPKHIIYGNHLYRREGMKYPARNDRNAGLTGPAIGETLPAARQREMNRQPGRMSGAGHHQTYPAILPGERDCPLFPYRRQILLSGERHSGLSGIENQTKGGVIMAMDYLTKESEEVRQAFSSLDRTALVLRQAAENYSPSIQSKRYLTGEEVCEYLHISPRTLQTLRDPRQITYTAVSDRVFLYPETEIREVLQRNSREAVFD